ncbi:MAG: NADH-quinone oxidoreductase subunit F [Acidobacteria bacterium]|nr:NADH-quinone oxidoreductase subunit F [Acidobacteriota bacterium]
MTSRQTILFPSGAPQHKEDLEQYRRRGGYEALRRALARSPSAVTEEVAASGLRGRGGAAFPTAQKMSLCAQAGGPSGNKDKYVVVNGGEDEPGSFKDRALLEYAPHAVLEGVLLAAYAVGATKAFFYTNETYQEARRRIVQALQEAVAANLVGDSILGSSFSLSIESRPAPTPYVAGEDTAVLEVLEGKPPLPRQKPPYPVTAGLFGQPTLVHNVETLANLPSIVSNGAAWFRSIGTEESFGTMLYSMNEEWARPGVYELPYGAREAELLQELAGGLKSGAPLRAILPGGPSSAFLLPNADRILSPESLKAEGSSIGCGVMRGYAEGTCMVEVALEIARFFEKEQCGQCPACRMETSMLANTLDKVRQGQVPAAALDQIPRVLDFNRGKGFCSLINMPGPPILSAIKLFPEDFQSHLKTGQCPK